MKLILQLAIGMIAVTGFFSCENGGSVYYLDSESGNDDNNGSHAASAWQSIDKLNTIGLMPGDRVLFKGGQQFPGTIIVRDLDHGNEQQKIVLSSYGSSRAIINSGNNSGLIADSCSHLTIRNLNFTGSGRKNGNTTAGIQLTNVANVLIDSIDVSGYQKAGIYIGDGGGFDFDGGVTNSILQYNYSYNNAGPGFGLMQYWGAPRWHNNIMRYNISVNDGVHNTHSGLHIWTAQPGKKEMSDALIYNNTIINTIGSCISYKYAAAIGFCFFNNIFIGGMELISGEEGAAEYQNNLYWSVGDSATVIGGFSSLNARAAATGREITNGTITGIYADPLLRIPPAIIEPLQDPQRLHLLNAFIPLSGSPCIGSGKAITKNGGRDFWGNRLPPENEPLDIGAFQTKQRKAQWPVAAYGIWH